MFKQVDLGYEGRSKSATYWCDNAFLYGKIIAYKETIKVGAFLESSKRPSSNAFGRYQTIDSTYLPCRIFIFSVDTIFYTITQILSENHYLIPTDR